MEVVRLRSCAHDGYRQSRAAAWSDEGGVVGRLGPVVIVAALGATGAAGDGVAEVAGAGGDEYSSACSKGDGE